MNISTLQLSKFTSDNLTKDFIEVVTDFYDFIFTAAINLPGLDRKVKLRLISRKEKTLKQISILDKFDKKAGYQALDIIIQNLGGDEELFELFNLLKDDYDYVCKFIDSLDVKYLIINGKKETINILLGENIDKKGIVDTIRRRVSIIMRLYNNNLNSLQLLKFKLMEIREQKENLEQQIKLLKQELRKGNKEDEKNRKTIGLKNATIDRLTKEKDLLNKQIFSLESEVKNLKEQDSKGEKQEQTKEIDTGALDSAMELASESEQKSQEYKKQLENVTKEKDLLAQQLELLKSQLNSSTQLDTFIFKCEQFPDDCDINDMLKYMTVKNCPLPYKKEIVDIITNFLEDFLGNISKGASSGMNGNEGVGGGCYANNYINPLVNYIKDKGRTTKTQEFLEFVLNIDLKSLTKDMVDPDYANKKSRIFSSVYEQLEDGNFMNIFEVLSYVSKKLENIKRGNLDLSTLSTNIDNFLSGKKDVLERKIKEVFLKIINQK